MSRRLIVILLMFFAGACGWAERVTIELQRDLEGYDGVLDTFLYAPSSVADINYGAHGLLNAGINRWGEHYVALVRFDLKQIPPGAEIIEATLWLYDNPKDWPSKDTKVDVQAVTQDNSGWPEGSNDGTRTPVEGTSCWNYLSYDSRPWAGAPGLREKGTDYDMPPIGSADVSEGHEGWVEFPLETDVVQRWVDRPETNAGMRIYPFTAKKKGEVFCARSSDAVSDATTRPKFVLEVEMDGQVAKQYWRSVGQRVFEATSEVFEAVRTQVAASGRPPRIVAAIEEFDRRLSSIREGLEPERDVSRDSLADYITQLEGIRAEFKGISDRLTVARAAAANDARGQATDFALGVADSMTNVVREPGLFDGEFAPAARLELAKNEFEAVQVVIVPIDADVSGATWAVTDLRGPGAATIPAQDVAVHVVGYMKKIKPAIAAPGFEEVDWWPAPILDFLDSVDVARGEVQPLWVCVRTREDTPAGVYRGTLQVKAASAQPKTIEVEVRVFDFAVPKEQHVLTVWGNNEPTYKKVYGDRYDKDMARAMFDFLIERRLAVNTLYSSQSAGEPGVAGIVGYPTLSDPEELKRLWEAGSRWWNLGYLHPVHAKSVNMELDAYVPEFIEMMRESLKVADAAGWPHSNLGIYFFDETRDFEGLQRAASQVKQAFPDIPLMTTGYDRSYGVKDGPIDEAIDIWCPLTPRFALDQEVIEEGRKLGKKAWWYVCCGPCGKRDLNFFCQYPAIRPRLLMGAATWKYQPDGFLYYRISGWRDYEEPMDTGPLTDWKPYHLPGPDGDGLLILPGPTGPLSTLQFENIRDGLEDYEYYWVLQDRVERVRKAGVDAEEDAALLTVPTDLLTSLFEYSEDPARLRAERRRIAEAIVRLDKKLEGK